MGDDHPAAAISLETEGVEDLFGILVHADTPDVLGIGRTNDLPTSETSHRDYHAITLTVGLLLLGTGTGSEGVLGQFAPVIVDDERPVVGPEDGLHLLVLVELNESPGDGGPCGCRGDFCCR